MARILNAPLKGRLLSSEAERATLGRIGTDGPLLPVGSGEIAAFQKVGGLHRRYERLAA
jgi:hypothetical protein